MRPADRLSVLGIAVIFLVCITTASPVSAFAFWPDRSSSKTVALGLFGNAFKDAFSNDDSLGKQENAGLKRGPNYSEVTINGKVVKNAVAGQKVSQVAAAAGQKITYSCKKGDCGTW